MIAFSLSRTAFAGLASALLVGIGASFLAGWLSALSQQPVADLRAMAAANSSTKEAAAQKDIAGQAEQRAEPAGDKHLAAAPPERPQAASPPAPAPQAAAEPAAPVAAPAKPETALAASFSQPMLRYAIPPAADAQPGAATLGGEDALRTIPQELNAEFGRLGDPLRPVYTVEAGLFTAAHSADTLYQRLDAERYDVYRVDGGSFGVAVRVGAFDDRRLAEQAAIELRARQGLDTRVLRVAPAMMAELVKSRREGP